MLIKMNRSSIQSPLNLVINPTLSLLLSIPNLKEKEADILTPQIFISMNGREHGRQFAIIVFSKHLPFSHTLMLKSLTEG